MTDTAEGFDCRHCGRHIDGETPDPHGWCKACRGSVVRRSGAWAVFPAVFVLVLYVGLLSRFGLFQSTFLVVWIALGIALAYVAFKVARRVLFDVIRNRAAKKPAT